MERTHYCGTLRRTHIGLQATVCGWVLTCRDMGGVIFVDVRDREGVVQTVFDQAVADPASFALAERLKNQSVVQITGEVRLSYVHLFEPYSFDDGQEAKYSCVLLIPKSDKATVAKLKAAYEAAVEKGKATKWKGKVPKGLAIPLRDGDDDPTYEGEEFEGHWILRASSRNKPGVVERHDPHVAIEDSTRVYSGCYARVSLNMFPYDAAGNKGVSAGLNNVQFLRDGESLGGRSRAADDFALADDEGEDFDELLGF